jgi:hypothetical protein
VQFDGSLSTALVASDSSDRSKDKMDQKVKMLYINCTHNMLLHLVLLDDRLITLCRLFVGLLKIEKLQEKAVWGRKYVSSFTCTCFCFLTNFFQHVLYLLIFKWQLNVVTQIGIDLNCYALRHCYWFLFLIAKFAYSNVVKN